MPTAFLVVWAIATVALAAYLIHSDRRDEARRRAAAAASDDVQPFRERGRVLSVAEGVFAPIALALLVSGVVGGLAGAFYKVFTS